MKIPKKSKLTWDDKMRLYLEKHAQEVFTPEFMEMAADRFLNVNTVRKTIKQMFPQILVEDILPNAEIIPDDYEE